MINTKLKIAVGYDQRLVLLEKFPDDEEHDGLNELLDHDSECFETPKDVPAGLYLATIDIEEDTDYWGNRDAYLYIKSLEEIK